ncbi:MAG: hypothetical protein ACOX85_02965 [Candidatus Pararuminococcus gallinarum]|jgi:hypothetical protein
MRVNRSLYIQHKIEENLLTALEKSAQSGDIKAVVRVSKYLLKTLKKRGDEIIEVSKEE